MNLERNVHQFISANQLFKKKDKVLVAFSGGPDSVALLLLLHHLDYTCEALHCNFHLRGEESMRDEYFARNLCDKLHVPFHRVDLYAAEYAKEQHISVEMSARDLRYEYFEKMRIELGAEVIAVAHHRDDSVETFLINLIRGTGINGLKGIRPKNGNIVRPLLCADRSEILNYLQKEKQDYVTDSTNLKDDFTRNKIRLNLLPLLCKINPSVTDSIAETALRLNDVADIYNKVMEENRRKVIDGNVIYIEKLLHCTGACSLLFETLHPYGFNSAQTTCIFNNLHKESGQRYFSDEYELIKDRNTFILKQHDKSKPTTDCTVSIPDNGRTEFGNIELLTTTTVYTPQCTISKEKNRVSLDADKIKGPIFIRKVRKGDKFTPFGMKGKKLLSDFMTDQKLTLYEKESQTVVCDEEKILWVTGIRVSELCRIDSSTHRILTISIQN